MLDVEEVTPLVERVGRFGGPLQFDPTWARSGAILNGERLICLAKDLEGNPNEVPLSHYALPLSPSDYAEILAGFLRRDLLARGFDVDTNEWPEPHPEDAGVRCMVSIYREPHDARGPIGPTHQGSGPDPLTALLRGWLTMAEAELAPIDPSQGEDADQEVLDAHAD